MARESLQWFTWDWFRKLEDKIGEPGAALLVASIGLVLMLLGYSLGMWIA